MARNERRRQEDMIQILVRGPRLSSLSAMFAVTVIISRRLLFSSLRFSSRLHSGLLHQPLVLLSLTGP